jgi:hypothetical protein
MKSISSEHPNFQQYLAFFISKIVAFFLFIKPYFFNFFMFIFTFLSPVTPIVITTILFIGLDTVMGVWKAKFLFKNEISKLAPNSNSFKRGFVPKALLYTSLILVAFVLDKNVLNPIVSYIVEINFNVKSNFLSTKLLALVLISIEFKSIDENFFQIYGVSLRAKLGELIKKLKQPLRNLLDNDKK